MAENHSSTRPPITRKPHRCQADVDLLARFICHANSTHVLQSLWRGLPPRSIFVEARCLWVALRHGLSHARLITKGR
jgi:hypothetical protein